jgi:DNA-binding transcriptional ArsR family regulator
MSGALDMLPPARKADVLTAVRALETTAGPLLAKSYRALAEPALREVVTELLAEAGRVLVPTGIGFTTGYDDRISALLAADGTGILRTEDRVVLTLVLLLSVAVPRAEGKIPAGAPWTAGWPVARDRLRDDSRVKKGTVDEALRRLQDADIVRFRRDGFVPGPQFDRLTPAATAAIFEELILLAEPEGALADSIRRRQSLLPSSPTPDAEDSRGA